MLDPMVFVSGIDSELLSPKFLGPLYCFSMVLLHGFSKGLPIKGKRDHLARDL